jgi:hypothetical protein
MKSYSEDLRKRVIALRSKGHTSDGDVPESVKSDGW